MVLFIQLCRSILSALMLSFPRSFFRSLGLIAAILPAFCLSSLAQEAGMRPNRIADSADLTRKVRVAGKLPTWVDPSRDAGSAPADAEIGLTFVLARAPEQQAAFEILLTEQQDPGSSHFHKWLTPQEIGEQFGPSAHDVERIVTWLRASGFQVRSVAPSRMFIDASAPSSVAASALSTEFRLFHSLGKQRLSATSEPSIPAAFAEVIGSVSGLTEVSLLPQSHIEGPARVPGSSGAASPQYTSSSGTHYLFPRDFATIFNINPLYNAGINGAGQKVAIIGRSRIALSDITAFETSSALAANLPNIILAPSGSDPGIVPEDEGESDLDLQRVLSVAPGVTADLVISGSTSRYSGLYLAAQYEVQTLLDPVMSLSYGACEKNVTAADIALWSNLFAQAAAEGISVFVSSGDSGAAFCDTQFATPPATQFRSINYICSNPYNTCVGGTEFVDTASPASFWASTNGTGSSSALSYIPEAAWNDPSMTVNGVTSFLTRASTGGASAVVAKPAWQVGVGVPSDGFRDVPDVSFPASGHDGYFGCQADVTSFNGDCAHGGGLVFSGTSAATPGWAGVTALLNQRTGISQGNLNPLIYRLAANPASGAFHDITPATTGLASCDINVPSLCNNSVPAPNALTGGLVGFPVQVGYDQVTGWGSADISKFVAAAVTPFQATSLTLVAAPTSIVTTQTVIFTATLSTALGGTPTGNVQFFSNGAALGSQITLSGGTSAQSAPQNFLSAGTYSITAVYTGDTKFIGSSSPAYPLIVVDPSKAPTLTVLTASTSTASTQQPVGFTAVVSSTSGGTPTGTAQLMVDGNASGSAVALSNGITSFAPATYVFGTHLYIVRYSGDATFAASTSAQVSLVINGVPALTITSSPASISLVAGASSGNTSTLSYVSGNGVAGIAAATCNIVPSGAAPSVAPTCTATGATLIAGGTSTGNLTVSTVAPHTGSTLNAWNRTESLFLFSSSAAATLAILLFLPIPRRLRVIPRLFILLLIAAGASALVGCGSGINNLGMIGGTTPGFYIITVTASVGGTTGSVTIPLTVQ